MIYRYKMMSLKVSAVLCLILSSVFFSLNFNPAAVFGSQNPGDLLVIDLNEEHLKGNMWWMNFLEDAMREGRFLQAGGDFDSIIVRLEFNFDSETLTGSLSGSHEASGLTMHDNSFSGGISGWVRKNNWSGFWFWEFGADVSLTLNFKLEQKITNETGTFWEGRAETINVVADLTGNTYAGEDGIGMFQINWQDNTRGFYLSCVELNERGACVLPGEFPKPIDIEIAINGPEKINEATNEAIFELISKGKDIELVEHVDWYFYYYDENYGDFWYFETIQKNDLSDLTINKEKLDSWFTYVGQYGIFKNGVKSLDLKVEVLVFNEEWNQLAQPVEYRFIFSTGSEAVYRILGLGLPMRHMKIGYYIGTEEIIDSADFNGYYELPIDELGEEYEFYLTFQYVVDDKSYFLIKSHNQPSEIIIVLKIKNEKIVEATAVHTHLDAMFALNISPIPIEELKLDDLFTDENGLISYLYVYQHISEALIIYMHGLKVDFNYRLPLSVVLNVPDEGMNFRAQYLPVANEIWIGKKNTNYLSELRPVNREYHEFSHFAMVNIYGKKPVGKNTPIEEVNHDGYLNPSTTDSFVEGFAYFMSWILGEFYKEKWGIDRIDQEITTENNYKAWEAIGKAECYAVAGTLWDLYDDDSNFEKSEEYIDLYKKNYWEGVCLLYDLNKDGALEGIESVWMIVHEKKAELPEVLKGISNTVRPWEFYDDLLVNHDSNYDDKLDKNELISYWSKHKFIDAEDMVKRLLDAGDSDNDGLMNMIEVDESYRVVMKNYFDELMKDASFKIEFDKFIIENKLENKLTSLPETQLLDDDKIQMDLEEIWDILKFNHQDFASVYDALINKYPEKKSGIDEIFVTHGFFIDTNEGNQKWDANEPYRDINNNGKHDEGEYFVDYPTGGFSYNEGEEVGRAANYQRKERGSSAFLPGYFVKVDNNVPFYELTVYIYDDLIQNGVLPHIIYTQLSRNYDGLVHVPVPPESYNSTIRLEPMDIISGNSLAFSSSDFYSSYSQSVSQGYFLEHHYELRGEIPPQPVMPFPSETEEPIPEPTPEPEPEPEPAPEPEPEPEPQPSPRGISGFSYESALLGSILATIVIWWLKRRG